jgi:hypothetical protein
VPDTEIDTETPAPTWEDVVGILNGMEPQLRSDLLDALFDTVLEP